MPPRFCAKSAEATENGRVESFTLAKECREKEQRASNRRVSWGEVVEVTTQDKIHGELPSRAITEIYRVELWKSGERSNGRYWNGSDFGPEKTFRLSPGSCPRVLVCPRVLDIIFVSDASLVGFRAYRVSYEVVSITRGRVADQTPLGRSHFELTTIRTISQLRQGID